MDVTDENPASRTAVRRRLMLETDIEAAATLLSVGFPHRSRQTWLDGLQRQCARNVPEGFPRFGLVLEAEDRLVGIVLAIYAEVAADGQCLVRCHFSSWYVDPDYKPWGPILIQRLVRDRDVTFVNISPAPHTGDIIESQGFRTFSTGWVVTLPWLGRGRRGVRVRPLAQVDAAADLGSERGLLEEHQRFGCICLVVEAEDGLHSFVFTGRRRVWRLRAASYLLYCRDLGVFARYAGPLGRALLRHGIVAVITDSEMSRYRIAGRAVSRSQGKYFRGPAKPRPGDNSYSELAIFGN